LLSGDAKFYVFASDPTVGSNSAPQTSLLEFGEGRGWKGRGLTEEGGGLINLAQGPARDEAGSGDPVSFVDPGSHFQGFLISYEIFLQRMSASYEWISTKYFGDVGRGTRTNQLDLWWRFGLRSGFRVPESGSEYGLDGFRMAVRQCMACFGQAIHFI